jgi:hypothetical protein
MSEWRTIDSAPKDGTWILAASEELGVCIVQFVGGDWYDDGLGAEALAIDDLTHWQPLPDLPTEQVKQ